MFKVESRSRVVTAVQQDFPLPNETTETFGAEATSDCPSNTTLNPRYTFESYIVGKQNEFAHAAAVAVSKNLGNAYNPFCLFMVAWAWKTHLTSSYRPHGRKNNAMKRVLYVTSETFTNEFINAVRTGQAREFKNRYRTVDILIVDDIQFFGGKMETQEEFFHTFNALQQQNKQIVLSSDRPPKAIGGLENRLLSRFESGVTADISSPDFETRVAILEAKCRDHKWSMHHEIVHYIAGKYLLERTRARGGAQQNHCISPTEECATELDSVAPIVQTFKPIDIIKSVTPRELISVVAHYFDITTDEVVGKSREKRLAFPRQIIMFLMREEMTYSYPSIGTELGGRDHTTAMHAYSKIKGMLDTDENCATTSRLSNNGCMPANRHSTPHVFHKNPVDKHGKAVHKVV